jgi:hypothetical protein
MSVAWTATSPESGRYFAVEKHSDVRELSDRFNELRSRGQGYLHVRLADRDFPLLCLGFRDDHAVIHVFDSAEKVSLLVGDGTVPSGAVVRVLIMDDLAKFTGEFVLSVDRAWDLVRKFIRTGSASDLGEWCEL